MKKIVFLLLSLTLLVNNIHGQESIFTAIKSGNILLLNQIIKSDPKSVNIINPSNHTPLIIAAYHNQIECLKILIQNGADINNEINEGSAIHGAAFKGHFEIVKILIDSGANYNLQDNNGTTPLIYATLFNHLTIIKLLLENGATIDTKDKTGRSAVEYANQSNNQEIINLFTSK